MIKMIKTNIHNINIIKLL